MTREDMAEYERLMREEGGLNRLHAAEMLREVASVGSTGVFTEVVTCEQLGWALARLCANSTEPDPLAAIICGYRAYADGKFRI